MSGQKWRVERSDTWYISFHSPIPPEQAWWATDPYDDDHGPFDTFTEAIAFADRWARMGAASAAAKLAEARQ